MHYILSAYPERKLLKLNVEAGGVPPRRVLERIVAAERSASASALP